MDPRTPILITDDERQHYETAAANDSSYDAMVESLEPLARRHVHTFANPIEPWLDAPWDSIAQAVAYQYIAPRMTGTVVQLGGSGTHAVKFLIGGASRAVLVTPISGEASVAKRLAHEFGVADRLESLVGFAESIPLADSSASAIYSGGCLHHTETAHSLREVYRVLEPGGRFAAAELWRAPLYSLGIKVFGKRERDVHCQPLDDERMSPVFRYFPDATVTHHGALVRYPLLAAAKVGVRISNEALFRIARAEERLTERHEWLRRYGGSISLCMAKRL
jgi:SAM-dependent methyltransferase